jgi:hypothetical protein
MENMNTNEFKNKGLQLRARKRMEVFRRCAGNHRFLRGLVRSMSTTESNSR